jgi:hypothetical protein
VVACPDLGVLREGGEAGFGLIQETLGNGFPRVLGKIDVVFNEVAPLPRVP